MKTLRHEINGRLFTVPGQAALLLDETADPFILRYALVLLETEQQIFPAVMLDDWGHETASLDLYAWLVENGLRFPRAEIFGRDLAGRESQVFVRELDLMARWPCYLFATPQTPPQAAQLVTAVLLPGRPGQAPERIKRPVEIALPLGRAALSWWRVDPKISDFDFNLLT